MKKIYLIFILSTFLLACQDDDDSVFEESSTVRLERLISECDMMLKNAENGWKIVYVPNPEKTGGFNILMEFRENERVITSCDFMDETMNSTYSFNASQGAVLCFDTYSCLHYLADPGNSPKGSGFEGEFEFVIQKVTSDSIVFTGKKYGYDVVFYPAEASDWDGFLPAARENLKKLAPATGMPFFRSLTMNSTAVNLIYDAETRSASITWADEVTKTTSTFLTAIYGTREGVAFKPSLNINGVIVTNLRYNENTDLFEVSDAGVIGDLRYQDSPPMPFYDSFTELSRNSNSVALPLIGKFEFSINIILEIFNIFSTMSDMSADLSSGYPTAVIAGLKQFKIAWNSPSEGTPEGTWLSYFGAVGLFSEGIYYYNEGLTYDILRSEGDQVVFHATGESYNTNQEFADNMSGLEITNTFRNFFTDSAGFTVVPAGNNKYYFVSIADSQRWMLLTRN